MALWTYKYRPRRLDDVIGNDQAKQVVRVWADSWKQGKPQKPLLLYGPPGVGKTATAYAVASEYGWDLIEMNASDTRNRAAVERILGAASQAVSLFGGRKLILIDEVDGLSPREDSGGVRAIVEILQRSKNPVILTANDAWAPSVIPLHPYVRMVEYRRIPPSTLAHYLAKILEKEGISYDREALLYLARKESGDVRAALLDLQAVARYGLKITIDLIRDLGYRDREANIFEVLAKIFKSERVIRPFTLTATLDMDPDMFTYWVVENVPREYEDPEEIAEAFHWISRSDVFNGRIIRRQYWGFLSYAQELLVNGVIIAKKRPYRRFTRYSYPTWIKLLSRYRERNRLRREVATKLGKLFHLSRRRVLLDVFPFLPLWFRKREWAAEIIHRARLTPEEVALILGTSPNDPKVKALMEAAEEARKHHLRRG